MSLTVNEILTLAEVCDVDTLQFMRQQLEFNSLEDRWAGKYMGWLLGRNVPWDIRVVPLVGCLMFLSCPDEFGLVNGESPTEALAKAVLAVKQRTGSAAGLARAEERQREADENQKRRKT